MTRGGKNLIILGALAITIAATTTTIALTIYHNSGDIYLDRSRPGYISTGEDSEKDDTSSSSSYTFSKTGEINAEVIEEYTENYEKIIEEINKINDPFSEDALSDETLGI